MSAQISVPSTTCLDRDSYTLRQRPKDSTASKHLHFHTIFEKFFEAGDTIGFSKFSGSVLFLPWALLTASRNPNLIFRVLSNYRFEFSEADATLDDEFQL